MPLKLVGLFFNNDNSFSRLSQGISHPSFFHHQGY